MREADVSARDLTERVHAGVGASGAVRGDRATLEFRQRVLEQALNGLSLHLHPTAQACAVGTPGLPLPADVTVAVVFERDLQIARGQVLDPGLTTGLPSAQRGHASAS